jgi:hypothetical protein
MPRATREAESDALRCARLSLNTLILSSFNNDIAEADLYELADASASGPGPDVTAAQNYIKTHRVVFVGGRIRGKDRPAASR